MTMPQHALQLSDLYASINWSNTDNALATWRRFHAAAASDEDTPAFRDRFRQTLLAYALPEEITGPLPDDSYEIRHAARWALKAAGVWDSVVDWLLTHELIGPVDSDNADQITLHFQEQQSL